MTETPERAPRTMDVQAIMNVIPHRFPILLVDRVLDFEPKEWIRAIKNISMSDAIFQGHFPNKPTFPGVYIIEALAQAGACLAMQSHDDLANKICYFMSIDGVKFRKPVVPGDQLVLEVKCVLFKPKTAKFRAEAFVDGQKVAEAEFTSMILDAPKGA